MEEHQTETEHSIYVEPTIPGPQVYVSASTLLWEKDDRYVACDVRQLREMPGSMELEQPLGQVMALNNAAQRELCTLEEAPRVREELLDWERDVVRCLEQSEDVIYWFVRETVCERNGVLVWVDAPRLDRWTNSIFEEPRCVTTDGSDVLKDATGWYPLRGKPVPYAEIPTDSSLTMRQEPDGDWIMSFDLPHDLYDQILELSERHGTTPEQWIYEALLHAAENAAAMAKSLGLKEFPANSETPVNSQNFESGEALPAPEDAQ